MTYRFNPPETKTDAGSATRDLPAIELALAAYLLALAGQPLPAWALGLGLGVIALALIRVGVKPKGGWVSAWALISGLAWGLFGAALLPLAGAVPVMLGLTLIVAAMLPVAATAGQMRCFSCAALAPVAWLHLSSSQGETAAVGGLIMAFALIADLVWRSLRPAQTISGFKVPETVSDKVADAVGLRQSWRLIDGGKDQPEDSEKQQFKHQRAQRHV